MYNQLFYDVRAASEIGIHEHPQKQMNNLGYVVLDAVPQSLYDGWWFTVKDFIEPLPGYLSKMKYNFEYWHNDCWKHCEYFDMADGSGPLCCYGGSSCIKEMDAQEIEKRKLQHDQQIDFWKNHAIDKIVNAKLVFEDGSEIPIKI